MDELWSFVSHKGHQQWVWLALDVETGEVVSAAVGNRSEATARQLWTLLPPVYRQCAVCYPDFWDAYGCVLPSRRHRSVGKSSGGTNQIERLNNTLRQRISRLVRRSLSLSKSVEKRVGAPLYFLRHHNGSLTT